MVAVLSAGFDALLSTCLLAVKACLTDRVADPRNVETHNVVCLCAIEPLAISPSMTQQWVSAVYSKQLFVTSWVTVSDAEFASYQQFLFLLYH